MSCPKEISHQLAVVFVGLKQTDSVLFHLDTIRHKQTRAFSREVPEFFQYLKDDARFKAILKTHGIESN